MTRAAKLDRKIDQLIALGVRLERIVATLPPDLRDVGNLKQELGFLITRVERASCARA